MYKSDYIFISMFLLGLSCQDTNLVSISHSDVWRYWKSDNNIKLFTCKTTSNKTLQWKRMSWKEDKVKEKTALLISNIHMI